MDTPKPFCPTLKVPTATEFDRQETEKYTELAQGHFSQARSLLDGAAARLRRLRERNRRAAAARITEAATVPAPDASKK